MLSGNGEACRHCMVTDKPLLRCARCNIVAYCSIECQTSHWKAEHRMFCKKKDGFQVATISFARNIIKNIMKVEDFACMIRAYAYHKMKARTINDGVLTCLVESFGTTTSEYICKVAYMSNVEEESQHGKTHSDCVKIPDMINIHWTFIILGNKLSCVSGISFEDCRIAHDDLKNDFNFDNYEPITFRTDAQTYCALNIKKTVSPKGETSLIT